MPVVDHERVQAVRKALFRGTYRIDAREIAERLIAREKELPP